MRLARIAFMVTVLGLTLSGCGSKPQAQVRMVGPNTASLAINDAAYNEPRSIGSMMLCVTSPATATITGVTPHEPSGDLRVEVFAVRPNPFTRGLDGLGDDRRPLADIGGGFSPGGPQTVSALCPTDTQLNDPTITAQTVELGVQVSWSSGDVAGAKGLDVHYDVAGSEATAFIPFGIWLCERTCPDGVGS